MSNPWIPPTGGSWDNLDLYLRSEQAIKLSIVQGDGNSTNIETAMNWLGDRVMSYSYIAGLSIAGRATDSAGNVSVITAGSDHQILRRNGTSLGFGSIDLSQSGAVGSSILGTGNGGTGLSAIGTALQYIRVNAGGTALEYATLSVTGFVPYTGATQDLNMGVWSIAATGLNLSGLTASRLVATNGSKTLESLSGTGLVRLTSGAITYDSSAYITLTSLSSTATGLSYSNTTGVFSLTAGYVIPTTNDVSFWNSAYNNRITSLSVTGSSGSATLLSNVLNIPTYTLTGLGATASTLAATQTFTLAPVFSAMTAGSVLFAGTSGLLSQDNGKFKYLPTGYNSNAMLMVNATAGSPTASAAFHVRGSGATSATFAARFENSSASQYAGFRDDGLLYTTNTFNVGFGAARTVQMDAQRITVAGTAVSSQGHFASLGTGLLPTGFYSGNTLALAAAASQGIYIADTISGTVSTVRYSGVRISSSYVDSSTSTTAGYSGVLIDSVINSTGTGAFTNYGILHSPILTASRNYMAFWFGANAAYTPNAAITDYMWSRIVPNINASVNSQIINGLDIDLSGSDGAFTGVTRNALRLAGGNLSLSDINILLGTTTGTKIGTATTQKIGLWNATPIVQPTTAIAAATFAANTSLIANDTATFDGYTIGQAIRALRNTGILA